MPAVNTRSMCRSSFHQIHKVYLLISFPSSGKVPAINTYYHFNSHWKVNVVFLQVQSSVLAINIWMHEWILYMAHENFHATPCVFTVPYHGCYNPHLRQRVKPLRSIYRGFIISPQVESSVFSDQYIMVLTHTSGQKFSACDQFIVVLL